VAPQFTIQSTHYHSTNAGVQKTPYPSGCFYHIYCDEVPLPEGSKLPADVDFPRRLVEKAIHAKLSTLTVERLNEQALAEALRFANAQLMEFNKKHKIQTLVSAVIIALNPLAIDPVTNEKGSELIIAGIGDTRVYQIDPEGLSLTFFDPMNPYRALQVSSHKRLISLDNALGKKPKPHAQIRKIFKKDSQDYLIASCGAYQQATLEELFAVAQSPSNPEKGVEAFFKQCKLKDNELQLTFLELKNSAAPKRKAVAKQGKKASKAGLAIALSAAVVAGAILLNLQSEDKTVSTTPAPLAITTESPELLQLQKQSQQQAEVIAMLKSAIDEKTEELQSLREELTSSARQSQASKEALAELEQASKTIDELRTILKAKENKFKNLTAVSAAAGLAPSAPPKANAAITALNSQLKTQYNALQAAYSQQKLQKQALDKAVAEIKQSLRKKDTLVTSTQESVETAAQETQALQELIIKLQKNTLLRLEQAKKQLAKQLDEDTSESDPLPQEPFSW
jgi:hypothetical protein